MGWGCRSVYVVVLVGLDGGGVWVGGVCGVVVGGCWGGVVVWEFLWEVVCVGLLALWL